MDEQVLSRAFKDINDVFSSIILDTNYIIDKNIVSWPNYQPGIDKSLVYAGEYQKNIDRRQFSFLLYDKSFFKFYFEWSKKDLIKAKIAFYPAPVKISGLLDQLAESAESSGLDLLEELYYGAEFWITRGIDVVNTSCIRIDFDSQAKSHAKCHIQIESINELRISSKYLFNPFIFFDWVSSHLDLPNYDGIKSSNIFRARYNYHKSRNYEPKDASTNSPYLTYEPDHGSISSKLKMLIPARNKANL